MVQRSHGRVLALLATWEKPVWLRHLVSVFPLRTNFPCKSCDPKYNKTHHCSVRFPVVRLRIPATGRRPDVLRIADYIDQSCFGQRSTGHGAAIRNFATSTHLIVATVACVLASGYRKKSRRLLRYSCCPLCSRRCGAGSSKLGSRIATLTYLDQSSLVAAAAFRHLFLCTIK